MANVVSGNRYNIELMQSGYSTNGKDSFSLVPSNVQIYLHSFSAFNANATASDIGLGVTNTVATWKLYVGNVNGGTPTNVTTAIQAGTTENIFDTTNNHGFLVECSKKFGQLIFNVTQAQSGSPVYSYQYWNGTSWATLNLNQTPVYTSTGYVYVPFNPPIDWATGDGGMGADNGYSIRVRSTTAGGQNVQVNSLKVARWFCYRQDVPSLSQLQVIFDDHPELLDVGEQLIPYYETANNLNSVEAAFQKHG